MNIPLRIIAEQAMPERWQDGCDCCCAHPVVTELDGDQLCQACADKWVRSERPDDDLVPIPICKIMRDDRVRAERLWREG